MTGSGIDAPAGAEVGWTKGAGTGSFSDKRAGVSAPAGVRVCETIGEGSVSFLDGAAHRVSWKVG